MEYSSAKKARLPGIPLDRLAASDDGEGSSSVGSHSPMADSRSGCRLDGGGRTLEPLADPLVDGCPSPSAHHPMALFTPGKLRQLAAAERRRPAPAAGGAQEGQQRRTSPGLAKSNKLNQPNASANGTAASKASKAPAAADKSATKPAAPVISPTTLKLHAAAQTLLESAPESALERAEGAVVDAVGGLAHGWKSVIERMTPRKPGGSEGSADAPVEPGEPEPGETNGAISDGAAPADANGNTSDDPFQVQSNESNEDCSTASSDLTEERGGAGPAPGEQTAVLDAAAAYLARVGGLYCPENTEVAGEHSGEEDGGKALADYGVGRYAATDGGETGATEEDNGDCDGNRRGVDDDFSGPPTEEHRTAISSHPNAHLADPQDESALMNDSLDDSYYVGDGAGGFRASMSVAGSDISETASEEESGEEGDDEESVPEEGGEEIGSEDEGESVPRMKGADEPPVPEAPGGDAAPDPPLAPSVEAEAPSHVDEPSAREAEPSPDAAPGNVDAPPSDCGTATGEAMPFRRSEEPELRDAPSPAAEPPLPADAPAGHPAPLAEGEPPVPAREARVHPEPHGDAEPSPEKELTETSALTDTAPSDDVEAATTEDDAPDDGSHPSFVPATLLDFASRQESALTSMLASIDALASTPARIAKRCDEERRGEGDDDEAEGGEDALARSLGHVRGFGTARRRLAVEGGPRSPQGEGEAGAAGRKELEAVAGEAAASPVGAEPDASLDFGTNAKEPAAASNEPEAEPTEALDDVASNNGAPTTEDVGCENEAANEGGDFVPDSLRRMFDDADAVLQHALSSPVPAGGSSGREEESSAVEAEADARPVESGREEQLVLVETKPSAGTTAAMDDLTDEEAIRPEQREAPSAASHGEGTGPVDDATNDAGHPKLDSLRGAFLAAESKMASAAAPRGGEGRIDLDDTYDTAFCSLGAIRKAFGEGRPDAEVAAERDGSGEKHESEEEGAMEEGDVDILDRAGGYLAAHDEAKESAEEPMGEVASEPALLNDAAEEAALDANMLVDSQSDAVPSPSKDENGSSAASPCDAEIVDENPRPSTGKESEAGESAESGASDEMNESMFMPNISMEEKALPEAMDYAVPTATDPEALLSTMEDESGESEEEDDDDDEAFFPNRDLSVAKRRAVVVGKKEPEKKSTLGSAAASSSASSGKMRPTASSTRTKRPASSRAASATSAANSSIEMPQRKMSSATLKRLSAATSIRSPRPQQSSSGPSSSPRRSPTSALKPAKKRFNVAATPAKQPSKAAARQRGSPPTEVKPAKKRSKLPAVEEKGKGVRPSKPSDRFVSAGKENNKAESAAGATGKAKTAAASTNSMRRSLAMVSRSRRSQSNHSQSALVAPPNRGNEIVKKTKKTVDMNRLERLAQPRRSMAPSHQRSESKSVPAKRGKSKVPAGPPSFLSRQQPRYAAKSTAEREEEEMKRIEARPFRAQRIPGSNAAPQSRFKTASRRSRLPPPTFATPGPKKAPASTSRPPSFPRRESLLYKPTPARKRVQTFGEAQQHYLNHGLRESPPTKEESRSSRSTTPKPPSFLRRQQHSYATPSTEEIELQECEKQFRARPLPNATSSRRRTLASYGHIHSYATPSTEEIELQECEKQFRARPLPSGSSRRRTLAPPNMETPARRLTTPSPFRLHSNVPRPAAPSADDVELAKPFRALPLPHASTRFYTGDSVPYHVRAQAQHALSQQRKGRIVDEEAREFKAKPVPKTTYARPVVPKKAISLTQPKTPTLSSVSRAEERKLFDQHAEELRNADAAMKEAVEQQQREYEEEEIRKQRAAWSDEGGYCFKALDVNITYE